MAFLLDTGLAVGGLLLLVAGAEVFVGGASALARGLGVSALVVGLLVVSVGTSSPELLVNLTAQLRGVPEMAMGNAVGSNIANLALVLGLAALFWPVTVHSQLLRREYPLLLGATLVFAAMCLDGSLGRLEGLLLVAGLIGYLGWSLRGTRDSPEDTLVTESAAEAPPQLSVPWASLWLVLGLAALVGGSWLLVTGAKGVALELGLSPLVIGLTVVALGTSLPELATSLAAAAKGESDLAVGNVVGSCLFNLLGVLGVPALLGALPAGSELLYRDLPVMLGLILILAPFFLIGGRGGIRIDRWEGALLALFYPVYVAWTVGAFGS